MSEAYIVAAVRTAGGRRGGRLADWHPADLLATVLDALVERSHVEASAIDDVIAGCVSQVGEQGVQVARNAVLASSLPDTVPAVTIDRQCGSSQQALHFAAQAVMSGTQDLVIAAGVESMSRVPMGSPVSLASAAGMGGPYSARIRDRYAGRDFDAIVAARLLAERHGLDRDALDAFTVESHRRAWAATTAGDFAAEILPVSGRDGMHTTDEGIRPDTTVAALAALKPLPGGGAVTAANAGQMADAAAGLLVASAAAVRTHGLTPLARIHQLTVTAGDPVTMLGEPITATREALRRSGLRLGDIDLYEVNEAFAPVPLAWTQALGADPARLNVRGGAIALGHPLGASGARLMVTLVHALRARRARFGLQAMCEGGGTANVTLVEAL